ncbi:hypothetical protein C8J55DRAFT_606956 [Lentinula edodes]|uniref:GmrSD restriction endonucleases N-terminal domain-containing protein n=1 Tax=Lentinula lateritia TaxID=40482 RepID=A0A9W9A9I0_9AGAR|nr:hypothetical protein C8J55DRAFT_606956 [Lentinula edodes]
MSSSGSDLSDFYDEPHNEIGSTQKQNGEYQLSKQLKYPRATIFTVQALYEKIHDNDIDLSPKYQRNVVWNKQKQINMIDSILSNYYMSPILFSASIDEDGTEHRTCIDGKQRLTSIHLFMDGLIPHKDSVTGQKYWYKEIEPTNDEPTKAKTKKQLLPENLRKMFAHKHIVCTEYIGLTSLEERDIFSRVQQGKPLKNSEKLGATSTNRTIFIRSLLERYVTAETLCAIPWKTSRGVDNLCFSHAVYCMAKWSIDPEEVKDHRSLKVLGEWLAGSQEIADDVKSQVHEAYDIFVRLATSPKYSAPFHKQKKVSPVEMIFIPLLIFVHGVLPSKELRYNLRELCAHIARMRRSVREHFRDVCSNLRVGKFLTNFIKNIEKKKATNNRKRNFEKEEAEDDQVIVATTSAHWNLSIPETPTMSSVNSNTAAPSTESLSTRPALKKRKSTLDSGTFGLNCTSPRQALNPSMRMTSSLKSRNLLSLPPSGSRSTGVLQEAGSLKVL